MATSPESAHADRSTLIRFAEFQLDLQTGELSRNGMKNHLRGQPLQLLELLLQHPGQLVTREHIQLHLWPDGIVVEFEHSVNAAVKRLREALGDNAENPTLIETIPRRGYRLIAPVSDVPLPEVFASVVPIKGAGTVSPISRSRPGSGWFGTFVKAAVLPIVLSVRSLTAQNRRTQAYVAIALAALMGVVALLAAGLVIALWPHHPIELKQRRLTANPDDVPVLGNVISPDGRYLAFSDKTGFYLRQIDTGETHPVSLPRGFNAVPAAWYPDGTHLIANWIDGPKSPSALWQISILGGSPRKLIDDGRLAAVSRDGSQIAFVRGMDSREELWIMGANGEKPRRLLVSSQRSEFGVPAWSPDGQRIAYVNRSYEPAQWGSRAKIMTLELDNGRQEVALAPASAELDDNAQLGPALAWTSDNHLVYSVSGPMANEDDSNVWSLKVDSRGHIAGAVSRLTTTRGDVGHLNASADGKRVVYTTYYSSPSIYISELSSAGTRLSTPRRLTLDEWRDFPFAWTPDSRTVLFVSDRDGIYHIFKQELDEKVPQLLVGGTEQSNVPRLAPDNSTVLYVVWPKLSGHVTSSRLMRIPLAGGPPQTVVQGDGIGNLQCARLPSTLCIYHVGSETKLSFFRFDPNTSKSEELPQLRIEDQAPQAYNWSLSPDGKILATVKEQGVQKDPTIDLHLIEDGSKRTITAKTWAGIRGIDFAADARSLWVPVYTNTGKSALLNIDLQGQTREMLEDTEMSIGWAIPSPDGKQLALSKARGISNVWMLERF